MKYENPYDKRVCVYTAEDLIAARRSAYLAGEAKSLAHVHWQSDEIRKWVCRFSALSIINVLRSHSDDHERGPDSWSAETSIGEFKSVGVGTLLDRIYEAMCKHVDGLNRKEEDRDDTPPRAKNGVRP